MPAGSCRDVSRAGGHSPPLNGGGVRNGEAARARQTRAVSHPDPLWPGSAAQSLPVDVPALIGEEDAHCCHVADESVTVSGVDNPAAFDRLGGALADAREVGAAEAKEREAVGAERVDL